MLHQKIHLATKFFLEYSKTFKHGMNCVGEHLLLHEHVASWHHIYLNAEAIEEAASNIPVH